MAETPDEILRALADPERLAIAGALAQRAATAAALAKDLELQLTRVRKHLNRLTTTGVVRLEPDRRTYRLDTETLRWAAEQVGPPRDAGLALGAANDDEEAVLRTFFRDGRLTEIPAKEGKRRIVLERIALEFEPGVRYDEHEVNAIVGRFFNDYASLRRYLVDDGFLAREHGEYWRAGGRVDDLTPSERTFGRGARRAARNRCYGPREPRTRPSSLPLQVAPPRPDDRDMGMRRNRSDPHRRRRRHGRRAGAVVARRRAGAGHSARSDGAPASRSVRLVRGDGEAIQSFSKRLIACAADRWPVEGGAEKAICIARARERPDPDRELPHRDVRRPVPAQRRRLARRYDEWTARTGVSRRTRTTAARTPSSRCAWRTPRAGARGRAPAAEPGPRATREG